MAEIPTPEQVAEMVQEAVSDMKDGLLSIHWYADIIALCDGIEALRAERKLLRRTTLGRRATRVTR